MGHAIGAELIAEGLKTEPEAQARLEMQVDYGQGVLLARPEPA